MSRISAVDILLLTECNRPHFLWQAALHKSAIYYRGVEKGDWYIGIYTLPKSGQVNFLWSNH